MVPNDQLSLEEAAATPIDDPAVIQLDEQDSLRPLLAADSVVTDDTHQVSGRKCVFLFLFLDCFLNSCGRSTAKSKTPP